jgi:hypothetical protein
MKKIMKMMKIRMPIQTSLFLGGRSHPMRSERSYLRRGESPLLAGGSLNITTIKR